jgi:hypothetical protein
MAGADPAGLLYGAIISAAVLATVSVHDDDATRVAITTGGFLIIYWMADVYIRAISVRFDGDRSLLRRRMRAAAVHESSVLKGGLPGIVIYLLAYTLAGDSSDAAFLALSFSIVLLMVIGYLGAHRAGTTGRAALAEAVVAGLFGVVIITAKSLLH